MKKLFLSFFAIVSLHAFAQDNNIVNDANAEKRILHASFNAIKISDGIDLYLSQSGEESIAVSASEDRYKVNLKTEVENGILKIYYEKNGMVWNDNVKKKLKAYVSFKTLEKLDASSGSYVMAKSVMTVSKLKMKFTSGSQFNGEVNISQLDVEQESGAEISMSGKAVEVNVDVSSGAVFKGFDLASEFCSAKASSGGGVRINVTKELNAKASSGGGIRYKGDGVIKQVDVNSGGMVKKA
jgi:ribosome-associated translation inhibitor RaiA